MHSASDNITAIENTSSTIGDGTRSEVRCALSIHHKITKAVYIQHGLKTHFCNLFTFSTSFACFWAIQKGSLLYQVF